MEITPTLTKGAAALRDRVTFDVGLGIYMAFLEVPRAEIVYVKLMIESYEEIGVGRSAIPNLDGKSALVTVFIAPDFVEPALALIDELTAVPGLRVLEPTAAMIDDLRSTVRDWLAGE